MANRTPIVFVLLMAVSVRLYAVDKVPLNTLPMAMKAPTASPSNSVVTTKTPSAPVEKPKPAYLLYNYHADRYRDPFIPLLGEARSDQPDRPPQITSLVLKGIVQDTKGRMALLSSGVSSYILRAGRLYDGRNLMVKGISGVIKTNSVLLIGSDRTVKELQITKVVVP